MVTILFNHLFNLWVMGTLKIGSAVVLLLWIITGFSQTISPMVFPSQGGTMQSGNLNISFTIGQSLQGTFINGGYEFSLGQQQPEQNLVVNHLSDSVFYKGTAMNVFFTALGVYGPGNLFTAQLSDSNGSFASPVVIGIDTGKVSGIVRATIPSGAETGTHYRIRVVSSYPSYIGGSSNSFAINRIEAPVRAGSRAMCSDTAVSFTFIVSAGNGGDEIEWATNRNFSGSTHALSPDTIMITVNPNSTDSIWVRSKDLISLAYSDSVSFTATVNSLPLATVYPADTFVNAGDTVIFRAAGGVFYYWPQVGSDSSSVRVIVPGDTIFEVQVTDAHGCQKMAYGHLELSVTGIYPNLYVINPDNPSDTIPQNQPMVGCHDILKLVTLVDNNQTYGYFIEQTFPQGIIPALNSLKWTISGSPDSATVPVFGTDTTVISYTWDSIINSIVWNIPGNLSGGSDFYLLAWLFTDCSTAESGASIITTPSTSGISAYTNLPTIAMPQLEVTFLNPSPGTANLHYAAPNTTTTEVLQICASTEFSPSGVYGFTFKIPAAATDSVTHLNTSLTLSNSYPYTANSHIRIYTSTADSFNVTSADLDTLLGQDYLSPNACIYTIVDIMADSCSATAKQPENYVFKIACNAKIPSSLEISTADISLSTMKSGRPTLPRSMRWRLPLNLYRMELPCRL